MSGTRFADIEASVDKLFGTGGEGTTPDTADTGANNEENPTAGTPDDSKGPDSEGSAATKPPASRSGTADKASGDKAGKPDATAQGTQPPAQKRNPGDLIGPDGNVIAKAGAERRHYEAAQAATRQLRTVQTELAQVKQQYEAIRTANALPQQLGLSPQEATTAAQFMAHWKRDPMGAAKNMIAELRAAGYSIDELGPGIDVSALTRVIDERLAPFQQDRQREEQQAELREQVRAEIERVNEEFPWLSANETELDRVMEANPTWSLQRAALETERWATANGFDPYQPLAPQVQARQANQPSTRQQPPSNARGPSGQGAAPNAVPHSSVAASVHRSNRDIVRETLREHGIEMPE